jgi:hypothetical protein
MCNDLQIKIKDITDTFSLNDGKVDDLRRRIENILISYYSTDVKYFSN